MEEKMDSRSEMLTNILRYLKDLDKHLKREDIKNSKKCTENIRKLVKREIVNDLNRKPVKKNN
tara:strand:- start:555 stop:743 length:189 start_codon:yes stop_codon:yes gene_type:complete